MHAPLASPLPLSRPTTNRLFLIGRAPHRRLLKIYQGPIALAAAHRETEAGLLRHWAAAGFAVPAFIDEQIPFLDRPHLVTAYVPGTSLGDFLRDTSRSLAARFDAVRRALQSAADRHARAFEEDDARYILRDANTGNFLLREGDGALVHLDLESAPEGPLVDAAARELARFIRWAGRDLGPSHLAAVSSLARDAYRHQPAIPSRLLDHTLGRRGQAFHRWRSRRRVRVAPWDVTKYDVADAIARTLPLQSYPA
jgi:Ser/Thr protein kinase RdoA (MazF antagonist)